MNPLLRRQVEAALGGQRPSPEVERLLEEVEAVYRRAARDRTALERALDLVAELIRREREPLRPRRPAQPLPPPAAARPAPATAPPPAPAPPAPPAPAPLAARRGAQEAAAPAPAPATPPPAPLAPVARFAVGLFEEAPFAALLCDAKLGILSINAAAEAHFGYSAAEVRGKDLAAVLFAERDRHSVRSELEGVLAQGRSEQSLRVSAARNGEARLDEWTVVPLRDGAGPGGAAILVRALFAPNDRFAAAAQAAGDAVWDWDLASDRLWLSGAWTALSGVNAEGEEPGAWLDRVHPSDREPLQAAIQAHLEGQAPRFENEHRIRHQGGGWRYVLARGKAVADPAGKPIRFCGTMMDITSRRAAADRVLHDALHDPLTRLPNRNLFLDLVKRSFARARRREGYTFAVLFLDLDHFKSVNDGLGHAAGDELLLQMARRLQLCLREGDTLARQGGDEFTILLDDVKDPIDAQLVASRIHEATSQPFEIGGHEVFSTTSIGIALSAPSYARPEDLLLDADTAMYRAKAQGRARSVVFDASMRERSPQLLHLEADLRRALLRDEFRVQYLPIFDVASGNVLGLEALLRWAHPKRGLLQPDAFVPFAEETGLIVPIGRWLLTQAGRDFQGCRRLPGQAGLRLHVNMSSKQLLQTDLLEHVESVLQQHQLVPGDLAVELTERTLQEGEPTVSRVAELRERGVRLYVDDFGSGFSSLSSLHRFQLDSLKIDQSLFVGGSPKGEAPDLVRTIVALAREMGKPVVAEGVETAEQVAFLRELGCSAAQGFYFSPPLDGDAARELLSRRPAH
jgi:diguanylate cyclase (GGDEF)-like protein/PAS domain S-box-containing protein